MREAGSVGFVTVVGLQKLLQLLLFPLQGSYLFLQVLLFGTNLIIFAANIRAVCPPLLSTLGCCDLIPLSPYPPLFFFLFRQRLFLRLMKEKQRYVDRIVDCCCDGYRCPTETTATIHALSFTGVATSTAAAGKGTSVGYTGGWYVGRWGWTGGRSVGWGAPGDGDVGSGGSTGHGDVGSRDRDIGCLSSLDPAVG